MVGGDGEAKGRDVSGPVAWPMTTESMGRREPVVVSRVGHEPGEQAVEILATVPGVRTISSRRPTAYCVAARWFGPRFQRGHHPPKAGEAPNGPGSGK